HPHEAEGISGARAQGCQSLPGTACGLAPGRVARRPMAVRFRGESLGRSGRGPDLSQEEGRAETALAGFLPQDSDRRWKNFAGGEDHRPRPEHLSEAADGAGGVDRADTSDLPPDVVAPQGPG